jgi:hypothetical protein
MILVLLDFLRAKVKGTYRKTAIKSLCKIVTQVIATTQSESN